MEKTGAGTLVLGAANTYTGGTLVSAGTLQLGTGGSLATTGALTVNGGTFDLNDNNQTVSSLSGTGGTIDLCTGTLTVDQSGNTSYAGTIIGTGGGGFLTKDGTGKLTLSGTNTYQRRHEPRRRHAQHLQRCQSGRRGRQACHGRGDHPRCHRRRHLYPRCHGGGRSLLQHRPRPDHDPERRDLRRRAVPGMIEVTGGGTLVLTSTANSYSGGTTVTANSTVSIAADGALGASPAA